MLKNIQLRCICTTAKLQASQMQIGRIINKVMSADIIKKNRQKHASHKAPVIFNKFDTRVVSNHPRQNRRVTVLNKLFMKSITDLMATGEVAPLLLGRGIEVTGIKVAPDYKIVNVYWTARNKSFENESTEKLLRKCGGHLQHELSQLRLIGNVPPIQFVKDKKESALKEIEDRLAKLDFGEDYIPMYYIKETEKKIPVLKTSLSPEIKAKLLELNSGNDEDEMLYEILVPEMKHNVAGFDHAAVMNKIKFTLNKIKTVEENRILHEPCEVRESQVSSEEVESFLSSQQEKQVFDEFLKKRLIDEKRKQKAQPLYQIKLQEEYESLEHIDNDYDYDEKDIEDKYDFENNYEDIKSDAK